MHFKVRNLNVYFAQIPTSTVQFRMRTAVGSSAESTKESQGSAHFLEHMLFKGTKKRSNKVISLKLSELGESNAHTDYDETAYFISTLPENSNEALEILFDMFFNSKLSFGFEKERNVIIEEHQASIDDPSSFFYGNLMRSSLGCHPVIGTKKSISEMSPMTIRSFIKQYYHSGNVSLHIAGPLTESAIKKLVEKEFAKFELANGKSYEPPKMSIDFSEAKFHHAAKQSMYGLVYPGLSSMQNFQRNFVSSVFNSCLGGDFASLLHQKIREELGLCYSIYCFSWNVHNNGTTVITTAMDKKSIGKCSEAIRKIVKSIRKTGFDPEVINYAKKNFKYRLAARTNHPGAFIETFLKLEEETGNIATVKSLLNQVDKISNDDLIEFANEIMSCEPKIATLNP